jgi:peptide/nickel transport system permease protein
VIRYTLTRLGLLVLGLAVSSVLIFASLRVLPGDVALLIGGTQASPEQIAALRESLGLTRPLWQQYLDWIGGVLRGDLGTSLVTGVPVATELADKARVTVPLAAMSLTVALAIGLPFGVPRPG